MADKAEFEVELVDDVSKPAKKAESALARLRKSLNRFKSKTLGRTGLLTHAFSGRARDERGRFTERKGLKLPKLDVGSGLKAAASGIVTAAVAAKASIAAVATGLTVLTVGMVDFGQRSRQAFSLLAKHGEVPEELFQRSIGLAQDLGLNIKDTTKQIQKFRALQFSQDQAEALIKMGADMQALGASGEEVSRIFAQLGQIKAKNKLQSEELVTLAESGVSTQVVFAALAKQLGKTEDAVKSMVSKGKITGSQALNAIGTAILVKTGTKKFGEAGRMMAEETLSGVANQFKAKTQATFLRIADEAAPAINRAAKAIFGEVNKLFEGPKLSVEEQIASQRFGNRGGAAPLPPLFQKIADAVKGVASAIENATPYVKKFLSGFEKGAAEGWKTFSGAFQQVTGIMGGSDAERSLKMSEALGKSFGYLAIAAGALGVAFGGVAVGLTFLAGFAVQLVTNLVDNISRTIAEMIFPFVDAFENVKAILNSETMSIGEKGVAIGKAIMQGILRGMQALAMAPINYAKGNAQAIVNAAKSALGVKSPSTVFEGIGKNTALGFQKGLMDLPTQNIIHSTLANDNGASAPVRGNFGGGAPAVSAGNGGGARTMNVYLKVQLPPGATREQGFEFGRGVVDGMQGHAAIHEYFDDVAIEEGVA